VLKKDRIENKQVDEEKEDGMASNRQASFVGSFDCRSTQTKENLSFHLFT
jgi:hypothetical protein